ncbi:uncharacterized protein LOC112162663 [Oryzias melastigma]|uniref:Uncharacterized LOC112162663 n=1 Tax=Oryzias melastigma TaxID=30732 RepID=A0A3B3DFC9_ORYME|nr:uncharacterized protein LOC112162663 [Oryzias melastigma]
MRTSLHLGGLQLTFLFFALLFLLTTVDTNPLPPTPLLPTVDRPQLESALHHLQVTLEDPRDSEPLEGWPEDLQSVILEPIEGRASFEEEGESDKPWVEEVLLRAQRGNLMDKPVAPFPGENSLDSLHYQEDEGEEGWKRNDALTSIAGGLQAVSREKGGFGFRFGRKRWTDRGWRDRGLSADE